MRVNRDVNCFFPVESKDCMNSTSYEYRKMSARAWRGGTIRTHWNAGCLLENFPGKNHENFVDYKLKHDVIFRISLSLPEPRAQMSYCHSALSVPPSLRPALTFTFSTAPLKPLFQQFSIYSNKFVFFRANRKIKMVALVSDRLIHFKLLLWNSRTDLNETIWMETKITTFSTKFVFFGLILKLRWPPWPLIGWDIFDYFSETAKRNLRNLDSKQDLRVLYYCCVFRADPKNKMATLISD